MSEYITISSTGIVDAIYSNEGKTCESCGKDATNGNNKIQFSYNKTLCEPCGEVLLEEKKQEILKMLEEGVLDE
tara:strand:- start:36 stop:257 length:222 start_codon:yes stop_codon:yes gene_type:complete